MPGAGALPWLLDAALREVALFAAIGILIGGIDDLAMDMLWLLRTAKRRLTVYRRHRPATAARLPPPDSPGRIAIFIGAWDEGEVIGPMLRHALDRLDHADFRIFVGVYPNDPATQTAVRAVQANHARGGRVRMVDGRLPGPTTKAECLNRLWLALLEEERATRIRFKAIVLHDAEDVVHPAELVVFDRLIERFALVQLPVIPLVVPGSLWISGHYCDEFAEAHGKQLVVREAIGAALPSAGVGCAIARDAIARIAATRGGLPFDADSLTEDYELGLRVAEMGGRGVFVRLPVDDGGPLVAVRAYFPATIDAAVRQKTRWLIGIALAGWDRLGWRGGIAEHWMRLRDRRAVLAALIVSAAYLALLLWAAAAVAHRAGGLPAPVLDPPLSTLCWINLGLLGWRMAMRCWMVWRFYGAREAMRAPVRMMVGNIIGIMAAWRALLFYVRSGRTALRWDKTRHRFPAGGAE
ncbi:glycosyl transferase family protein [Edaphosphingomonas haloaromaticamans]|uniref:glycosyl transferase family protein n=1 Tax=Edaphosphingomonas haloaromaticamans TaxID=653954 RepID=UPI0008A8B0B2|nr:glycosyl transferase family protein [Sphingomonas haloaromaticamans]